MESKSVIKKKIFIGGEKILKLDYLQISSNDNVREKNLYEK